MKNQKKIAASTKKPRYPAYEEGGRIVWIRPGMEDILYGSSQEKQEQPQAAAEDADELKITISD